MSSPETDLEEAPAPEVDEAREGLVSKLAGALGGDLLDSQVQPGTDVWARVSIGSWLATAEALRGTCGMSYFNFLSAIDWLPSPFGRDMDAQVDLPAASGEEPPEPLTWGVTGGTSRFQLLARVHDPVAHLGVTVKADLDPEAPSAPTWTTVYPGADWHEREVWEMFGIDFRGHPNLAHLYLPSQFEGHPLRKDYPLLARRVKPWPGIVDVELMPGEEGADTGSDDGVETGEEAS